jgi:pyridoxal phosphate enzyme (YggS family)
MNDKLLALKDQIVVVSKNHSLAEMRPLYDLGFRAFGENRVQELVSKLDNDMPDISWHLIGHLQRNKVKTVVSHCCLIHSVDSLALLNDIDQQAGKIGKVMPVLIQVNVANEATKFGIMPEQLDALLSQAKELTNVDIKGLMVIGPHVSDPQRIKQVFTQGKQLFDHLQTLSQPNLHPVTLSMGMSQDYQIALACGSTMLRLGHIMFGLQGGTMQ